MAVSSTDSRADFAGDGTSTSFTIPYFFIADNDIEARLTSTGGTETVFVDGTEYTLSGKGVATGGELTLVSTDFVPKTGEKLTIRRLEQFTQPTDLTVQGALPSATLEEGFDRLTMLVQQLNEQQGRMMVAPVGESGIDLTLPSSDTRASKALAYDSAGKPIASAGSAGSSDVPVTSFGKSLIDDASSTEARATLDAQEDVITTRGDMVRGSSSGAAERLALGTVDQALVSDGTDLAFAGIIKQGTHAIWVPASFIRPTVSNGCAPLADVETTAGRPDMQVLDFDASADEHGQFGISFPSSWDEGTVTFRAFWTTAGAVTTGIAIALQGVSVSDNGTIDVVYGTAVVVTDDALGTAEDLMVTAESAAVTIAGTPAANDECFFRAFRDVSDANDDMTQDMRLIGIQLLYTVDAGTDT